MRKGKPTVEDILELKAKCDTIYGPLYGLYTTDEQYYELDFAKELKIPEEYKAEAIVLPTGRDIVDTAVDHTDIAHARVFANKKGISKASEDETEMLRKLYLGIIHRTNVEADISPWRVAAKHYWMHGLAVFKTIWDVDAWGDRPKRKESETEADYASRIDEWRQTNSLSIPIIIKAINPANIMPDPDFMGRSYVFERYKKLRFNVEKMYPHWENPQGRKIDDYCEFVSWWDDEYRCDLIDGAPVLRVKGGVVKHNYGFNPYTLIESGLGNMGIDAEPEKRYVGLLRYIYGLLRSESSNYSLNDVVLKRTALPWGVIKGENAAAVKSIDVKFGAYTPLPEGVELEEKVPQAPAGALTDHMMRTNYYITSHAAPNSVRGLPESGVRSGADRRLMIAEAGSKYSYSQDAFSNGTAQVLIKCAKLIKNVIPGDVRVWARTPTDEFDVEIKKDLMKEPFTCYVEFSPISEEDEYRRHDDLERLVAGGIVTKKWARSQMSNVDPQAMEKDEQKQLLKATPAYLNHQNEMMNMAIQERMSEIPGYAEQAAAQGPMGAEGGGMPPEEAGRRLEPIVPNRAQPGSAEEMQNRMKAMRSQAPMSATQGMGGGGNRP